VPALGHKQRQRHPGLCEVSDGRVTQLMQGHRHPPSPKWRQSAEGLHALLLQASEGAGAPRPDGYP
jgi:oxalate decarboxylase/phosphoglucose isomerase-like protein (cupin superfamily)